MEENIELIQRKKTLNKFLLFAEIILLAVLATAYVIWLIKPDIVNIPIFQVEWLNSPTAYYIVAFLGYLINSIFLYSIIFKIKLHKGLMIALPTMILWPFLAKYNMVMSTLVPFCVTVCLYIIQLILKRKKGDNHIKEKLTFKLVCSYLLKNPIIRFILLVIGISIYQYISGIIKLNAFKIGMNILTTFGMIMYSIDLYIVYALLYIISQKEDIYNGLEMVLWKFRQTFQPSEEILEKPSFSLKELSRKQKILFLVMAIGIQLLQLFLIGVIGFLQCKPIELVIILITLVGSRTFILKKTLHANSLIVCTGVTCVIFWALLKLTPPLGVSIFLGVILTLSFTLSLYFIATILEDKHLVEIECTLIQNKYNELLVKIQEEDINAMSEEELTAHCIRKGLNNVEIAIVINKIIHKKKNIDILPIIGYEKTRFYEIRNDIIKKGIDITKK